MATWTGWQNQFLNRAGIFVTPPNRQLLTVWAQNATSNCQNNPIDMTHKLTGSTDCHFNTGIHSPTQNYTSHAQAATAFRDQMHAAFAAQLLKAMNTGNPYQVSYSDSVVSVFVSWGSVDMADAYASGVQPRGGGGGEPAKGVHKGWADLQRSLSKHRLGVKLSATNRMDAATLRALRRAHRVRIR